MSQACYAENCTNPVVGQCLQGYKGSCGRFYCRQHQSDGLCGVCNGKKSHDEEEKLRNFELRKIIDRYTELAEEITVRQVPHRYDFLICFALFVLSFIVPVIIYTTYQHISIISLIAVGTFVILTVLYISFGNRYIRKNKKILKQWIDEATKENSHFDEFYEMWKEHKSKKNKEELRSMVLNTLGFSAKLADSVITQAHKENKKLDILK